MLYDFEFVDSFLVLFIFGTDVLVLSKSAFGVEFRRFNLPEDFRKRDSFKLEGLLKHEKKDYYLKITRAGTKVFHVNKKIFFFLCNFSKKKFKAIFT